MDTLIKAPAGTAVAPEQARGKIPAAVILARTAMYAATSDGTPDPATIRAIVRACSSIADPAQAMAAWAEYADAVATETGLEDGTLSWYDIAPDLTCGERTETAREIARQMSADALAVLMGGQSL
jgi:hypothetical protein